jgi:predicted HD phosphohydrolase
VNDTPGGTHVQTTRVLSDPDQLLAVLATAHARTDSIVGGDVIDVLSHSLQCAAVLRARAPQDLELQVAGLVHDIGHLLVPGDADGHGRHGADAVRPLLGARVADLVELHVPAKRYLVTTDAAYRSTLSRGSVHTLSLQGGRMTPPEVRAFEAHPSSADAVTLRRADEDAKVPGRSVPGLDSWRPTLQLLAAV